MAAPLNATESDSLRAIGAPIVSAECEDLERRFDWLRVMFHTRVPTGVLASLLSDIQQRMRVVAAQDSRASELRALRSLCDRLASLFVRAA